MGRNWMGKLFQAKTIHSNKGTTAQNNVKILFGTIKVKKYEMESDD